MSITAADIEKRIAAVRLLPDTSVLCNCPLCFEPLCDRSFPETFVTRRTVSRHWERAQAIADPDEGRVEPAVEPLIPGRHSRFNVKQVITALQLLKRQLAAYCSSDESAFYSSDESPERSASSVLSSGLEEPDPNDDEPPEMFVDCLPVSEFFDGQTCKVGNWAEPAGHPPSKACLEECQLGQDGSHLYSKAGCFAALVGRFTPTFSLILHTLDSIRLLHVAHQCAHLCR